MGAPEFKVNPDDSFGSYEKSAFLALDRVAHRLSLLSEASRRLSSALSDQECFQHVLELIVPTLSDYASIFLLSGENEIRRVALAHVDAEKAREFKRVSNKRPLSIHDSYGPGLVIRTRKSDFDWNFDSHVDEYVKQFKDPDLVSLVLSLRVRSRLCVPIEAHGQILGALWMAVTSDSGRRFDIDELKLAEEVAARTGLVVYLLFRYERATKDLERLQLERDFREAYVTQIRHDVLSVLSAATLSAQLLEKKEPERCGILAKKIVNAIERTANMLRDTKSESK
jgi:GAF domain-containing protein